MTLPSPDEEPDRYQGRPLLLVMENYVLAAVGELSKEKNDLMTVVVRRVFGGGRDWIETVRARLRIDKSLDEQLRTMWSQNQRMAREEGVDLHAVQFAKLIVDQNFAGLIGDPLE
jgi:hypothetical protein